MYDTIHIEQNIDGIEEDIDTWQTKTLQEGMPMLDIFKLRDNKLMRQEYDIEELDEEIDSSFADSTINRRSKNVVGYTDKEYHGTFEIHTADVENEKYISYRLKFINGKFVNATLNKKEDIDITGPEDIEIDDK